MLALVVAVSLAPRPVEYAMTSCSDSDPSHSNELMRLGLCLAEPCHFSSSEYAQEASTDRGRGGAVDITAGESHGADEDGQASGTL